jgi:A/G-specific adenine glycosylase
VLHFLLMKNQRLCKLQNTPTVIQRTARGFHSFIHISTTLSPEKPDLSTGIICPMPAKFSTYLLKWYRAAHRLLPWRGEVDPYRIWVSEVMLQQTQVETVIPYYAHWLQRFPTVQSLAEAPEREVLALWEGMGYYARARNLHRAAQLIVSEYHGQLPRTVEGWLALPGVGRYTAAAIASLAFGADAAVLDGNVKRVLARTFNLEVDVKSSRGEKLLWALAQSLVPPGEAGDYNQAIMDLGATVCTPRAPQCAACPVQSLCAAKKLGAQQERPAARARAPLPLKHFAVAVICKRGRVLLVRRQEKLLGGLWAFPSLEGKTQAALRRAIREAWKLKVEVGQRALTLTHTFSHFRMAAQVYACQWQAGALPRSSGARWAPVSKLTDYPMGKIDRQIARTLNR